MTSHFRNLYSQVPTTVYHCCHVAVARKRSHQWCLTLTPNNTRTIARMTCHCFLRPIRRDLTSSSYTTDITNSPFLTVDGFVRVTHGLFAGSCLIFLSCGPCHTPLGRWFIPYISLNSQDEARKASVLVGLA